MRAISAEMIEMYRENIYNVIGRSGERVSTILIPENSRLRAYTWEVLKEAGLKMDGATAIAEDALRTKEFTFRQVRGEKIPEAITEYARNGEVVFGITGDDLLDEYRFRNPNNILKVENTYDWFDNSAMFYRPALCLVNRTGRLGEKPPIVAIGEKYRETSRDYLFRSPMTRDFDFGEFEQESVKVFSNGVEKKIAQGKVNCAIDIVYTGQTLRFEGLSIVDIVRFTDLVVVSPLGKGPTLEALARKASSN